MTIMMSEQQDGVQKQEKQTDQKESLAAQKRRTVLDRHLRKTKLCVYFQQGTCKHGSKCGFAHGKVELHESPALYKTRICPNLENCTNENCTYAHGYEELRCTDFCFKTAMCIWNQVGKCRNGEGCRFAHGKDELRTISGDSEEGKKAEKAKKKVDDKVQEEVSNVSDIAAKGEKSKTRAARRAAAKKMIQSNNVKEENLAPVQEEGNFVFHQPMFVQTGTAGPQDFPSLDDWSALSAAVQKNLLEKSGFLDPLCVRENAQADTGVPAPPPGLQPSPQYNVPVDNGFNIIPDIQAQHKPRHQPPVQPVQDIHSLAQSIQSLSEQLRTLEMCIAQQSLQQQKPGQANAKVKARQSSGQSVHSASQGYSESTKSGSDFNHSSNESSPPSTPVDNPNAHQEKLFQLQQFSRELQAAFGSNMNLMANRDFMAYQHQLQQQQGLQQRLAGMNFQGM